MALRIKATKASELREGDVLIEHDADGEPYTGAEVQARDIKHRRVWIQDAYDEDHEYEAGEIVEIVEIVDYTPTIKVEFELEDREALQALKDLVTTQADAVLDNAVDDTDDERSALLCRIAAALERAPVKVI